MAIIIAAPDASLAKDFREGPWSASTKLGDTAMAGQLLHRHNVHAYIL